MTIVRNALVEYDANGNPTGNFFIDGVLYTGYTGDSLAQAPGTTVKIAVQFLDVDGSPGQPPVIDDSQVSGTVQEPTDADPNSVTVVDSSGQTF